MASEDGTGGGFRSLRVWHEAKALAGLAYRVTARFPRGEQYAVADQIRRAASSIYANIAEGSGRPSRLDFARYLSIAWASLRELDAHVEFAHSVNLITDADRAQLCVGIRHVGQLLSGLRRRLR